MKPIIVILLVVYSSISEADKFSGRVVRVTDGDTITVLAKGNEQIRVRLGNIDCPETSKRTQPWGNRARQALADLVAGSIVQVKQADMDRYGRVIGLVNSDRVDKKFQNANQQLVAEGHCWVYPIYNRDPTLPELENKAKQAGLGFWSLPASERVPPWKWRRN